MDNIITEDYVSFETAEFLEKKGFDENCVSAYQYGELTLVSSLGLRYELGAGDLVITFSNSERKWNPDMISAPTLQMAMKWLREVHNIAIDTEWEHLWYAYVKPMTSKPCEDDYHQCESLNMKKPVKQQ